MKCTEKDIRVISALREDSRSTLKEISKKTGIPISTIYEKLKCYKEGIIKKNTAIIDFKQLGFSARAKVLFRVDSSERQAFKDCIIKSRNTNSVFRVNNGYDFMAEFVFKDMQELEDYLDLLETKFKIKDKQTFFVVEDLKRESFISLSQQVS